MLTTSCTIYTIGHSTHPIEEFLSILRFYQVSLLVDVRSIPKSRHVPQFNQDNLMTILKKNKIEYLHLKGLGGLRRAKKDSVNQGWHNLAFRGFADYMQTEAFEENLEILIDKAKHDCTAIMCAEAVPWRCHRSLIGDALLIRGLKVIDIIDEKTRLHTLTPFAKVEGNIITYPQVDT